MAAPPPGQFVPEGEDEEYESDEYDVEDDEVDADFQGDDGEGDEEDDDDDEEEGDDEENGQSLTALLVSDANPSAPLDDEDEDGYAPPGETDPAYEPIDGNARTLASERAEDSLAAKDVSPLAPLTAAAAAGMKRKSSGDEEDGEDDDNDEAENESDTKKLKV